MEEKKFANGERIIVLSYESKGLVLCGDKSWNFYHGIHTSLRSIKAGESQPQHQY